VSTAAKEYKARELKKKSKFSSRVYNRCSVCGRSGSYNELTGLCRIHFRTLAHKGELPGIKKVSL